MMPILTKHQLPARDLPLLKRYGHIDIILGEQIADPKITLGIDPPYIRVEVSSLFGNGKFPCLTGSSAELDRLLKGPVPCVNLLW